LTVQIQQYKLCIEYFRPYHWARNSSFKGYTKNTPMDVSASGTSIKESI